MPSAGDPFLGPGGLPISHSPLERLAYFPNRPEPPDLNDLIDAVQQWLGEFLFPAIKRYTGIDLSPFLPYINNVVDNLQLLFGFLDQDTSTFDKVAAGAYLIENVLQYTGLLATIESLGKLMTGIDNASGGLISQFFNDIRYIIGDPLGLGTGTVIIGSSPGDIPLLAPVNEFVQTLIDAIINALGYPGSGYNPANVLSYLTSLVGDVSGLVSGVAAFVSAVGGGNMAGAGAALAGVASDLSDLLTTLETFLTATGQATWAALGPIINQLIDLLTTVPAELISGTLTGAVEVGGRAIDVLVQHLNAAGQYDAAYLLGEIGDAVTVGGEGIATVVTNIFAQIQAVLDAIFQAINGGITTGNTPAAVKAALEAIPGANILISGVNTLPGYLTNIVSTGLYDASAGFQNLATSLLKNLTPTGGNIGQFNAAGLTGAFNTAVTIGGQAISSIFNGSGQFIGVLNSAATGALNSAITVGGTTLSTLFTNINSSGQLLLSGATGALNTAVTIGGQAVSSLFNGSGQFIGVINSAATGALNTAITVGGTAIGTAVTNANSAVTNINSLISGVSGSVIADVSTAINTAATNAQGVINGIVNGVNNSAVTGQVVADAQTAINNFVSGVVNNLQGIAGTFGLTGTTSANGAFAAAAAAQAAQAAEQARITSAFNAVFNVSPASAGNVSQTVDFSSTANQTGMSGIMSPGSGSGAGYMGITSGAAAWQGGTGTDHEVFPTQTATDYQVITATLGPLNDIASGNVATFLIGRVNSARDTYVYATFLGASVSFGFVVSGTPTSVAVAAVSGIATGGTLKMILGDPSSSSPYAMQVTYNGTPVITYTDSAHVSQLGASYRYVGLRMQSSVAGKYSPAIRSVNYQDNPPAGSSYPFSGTPAPGTKGRMYVSNDVGLIQRDNGSAWEYVWGGPLGYFTKPPSSGWSWVNQGTASNATELGGERITAPSSTRNWRLRTRTLTPASNYSATVYLETAALTSASGTSQWYSNIGLRNSTSGRFITFGPAYYTTNHMRLVIYRWTNATTFSNSSFDNAIYDITGAAMPNWYRIRDDGTNRYFEYSLNGVDWILVFSEGRTAFITPDQFIFGATNEGTGYDAVIRLRSLAGIS